MPRTVLVCLALLLLCGSALAADEKAIHDCEYWRLAKDDAEKSQWLKACDRIIGDKQATSKERAYAYASRADHASSDSRKDDAIADFDQALALKPEEMKWRRDRGMLLHFREDHDRAIEDFDKIVAAKPDGHVTFFRGLSYLAKGDDTRGFADLAKGIELAPDGYWYRYWRGLEYAKRGKTDVALADLDQAVALKSDEVNPYLLRAELYTKKGETEKAIADLTRAADLNPKYTIPYINRVLLYEQTGQYDRALADYDTLLSLSPGDERYKERRAALLSKGAASPPPSATQGPAAKAPPPAPEPVKETAPPPEKVAEPLPEPRSEDTKVSKPRATAGKGECRRYDAIANMTIAVPCPD